MAEIVHAASAGDLAKVRRLVVQDKSCLNARDERQRTALYAAARSNRAGVVDFLISAGADLNIQIDVGSTPLHAAAWYGHARLVDRLLAAQARTDIKNRWGMTAEDDARHENHNAIAQQLATRREPTSNGASVSSMSLQQMKALLKQHGVDYSNCIEKGDFQALVANCIGNRSPPAPAPARTRPRRPAHSPAAPGSRTAALRKRGNDKYLAAWDTRGVPASVRMQRGKEALLLYEQAKAAAHAECSQDDWLSAAKNVGSCQFRLAKFALDEQTRAQEPMTLITWRCEQAVIAICSTVASTATAKTMAWRGQMHMHARAVAMFVFDRLVTPSLGAGRPWQQGAALLQKLLNAFGSTSTPATAYCCLKLADVITKEAVRHDEKGEWPQAKALCIEAAGLCDNAASLLRHCGAERVGADAAAWAIELREQVVEVSERREAHLARAEAQLEIERGDEARATLLDDAEELATGIASGHWDFALDSYRRAMLVSRGQTAALQFEAIATSKLGQIVDGVLKLHDAAESLFKNAVQLGLVLSAAGSGLNVHSCGWYRAAKKGIEANRTRRLLRDNLEMQKRRAPELAKLKPQLDAITAALEKSEAEKFKAWELLNHLYKEHPPRRPPAKTAAATDAAPPAARFNVERTATKCEIRKALVRASRDYHPDKNKVFNDITWYVLCEEIQKHINTFVSAFKGCG